INYHYGGYLFYSIPLKVFGVPPEMGYNLVIPTVAALAASIAFCLGRALWGRCRLAGISVLFILFVGNLAAFFEIFNGKTIATDLFSWRWGYLWKTSRVIRDAGGETINEYPFFSILWGDIHPHFSNIPFVLLFMVIAFALYQAIVRLRFRVLYRLEWPLLATAVVSGALLFPTNVFDFPVFSLFLGAVVLAGAGQSFVRNQKAGLDTLSKAGLALLPLGSYLLAFPFWFYFESPLGESPLRWVEVRSTSLDMILVFGAHLVGSLVFLFLHRSVQIPAPTKEDVLLTLSGYGLIVVALWVWTGAVMAAMLPVIALLFWLTAARAAWSTEESYLPQPVLIFAAIACALGWSLIAGCEYIYLKDNYGVARMNTLFKFHFPAWILLGAGLPPLVYFAFKQQKNAAIRSFVGLPLALVVLMALAGPLYCLQGIYTMPATQTGNTLNGIAFLQKSNPLAFEIIHWLRENSRPGDRILEPAGSAYQLENLFSTHTGRATIVGWVNHEHLWRPQQLRYNDGSTEGVRRQQDSFRFFTTPNWDEAKGILKKYEIRYVAFTPPINAEIRNRLAGTAQAAYRAHLEPVFKGIGNGQSPELYRVPETLD
ncbi:MAG: DUF2298 domain-containing protein, partial [bacterium]|nr:DUF2298 domain-containing protein [bacterium]